MASRSRGDPSWRITTTTARGPGPVLSNAQVLRAQKAKHRQQLLLAKGKKVEKDTSPRPQYRNRATPQERWWTQIGQELWQPKWK